MAPSAIEQGAAALRAARSVCVSTGAGMSAESGLATFRDADGLWSKFNPMELATPEAFGRDPRKVWAWYRLRRQRLAAAEPHDGHRVLAAWEARVRDFTLVTQNVDGLHQRAGSRNVIELHGRLDLARCESCPYQVQGLDDLGEDPHCPECGRRLRPGVVWFGELLPAGALEAAFAAARRCDAILVIGTSGVVQPAASLAEAAHRAGACVIEINPNTTELSHLADVCVRMGCREALRLLDAAWRRADRPETPLRAS